MNIQQIRAFEALRTNSPKFKQSYSNYVAFLTPKIWEIPDVRLSRELREKLTKQEIIGLGKDIRETENRIIRFEQQYKVLKNTTYEVLDLKEKRDISTLRNRVQRCQAWINDLRQFRKTLSESFQEKA